MAMKYRQIVILIVSSMFLMGIYALVKMPKQEFPVFTVRQGVVIAVYPGATSDEVEEQVTRPLENFIFEFKEVKKSKTHSLSRDGMAMVFVELNDDVTKKDEFWAKFKHRAATFKSELPTGVIALITNDDFGDTSAILITIESKDKTYRELEGYLDELKSRLRHIDAVSNLRTFGEQKEQIGVYLDPAKLSRYAIGNTSLAAKLLAQGFTTMSGSVDNSTFVAPIHVSESYDCVSDVANQIVFSDPQGNAIRLKDVARVVCEYPDPSSYITNNGTKCLVLSMEMREGNNIVQMGKEVNEVLEEYEKELPDDVSIFRITDQSQVVGDSVATFLRELLIAIVAVIIVVMLLMPLKVASVAASTIPITIALSLLVFYLCGVELNMVTLAALIASLGMIVDNSIVIIDCYMEKLDNGVDRWTAAIDSAKEFFKSIFSATLAISITFFPFLFTASGMIGDFVKSFPWAMTIILFLSLLVAVLLIPYMQYHFIRRGFKRQDRAVETKKRRSFLDKLQSSYDKLIVKCFAHPARTMGVGALSVVLGVALFLLLPQRLMPIAERNQFAVEIYLPAGSALEQTVAVADSLEAILQKDPRVVSVASFKGDGSPRFHTVYAPQMPGTNYAQFIVNTTGNKATEEMIAEYKDKYLNYFPNVRTRFKQLENTPAAYPIEIRVKGENRDSLLLAADRVRAVMSRFDELSLVHDNWNGQLPGVSLRLKDDEMSRLGLDKAQVSAALAMHLGNGLPVTTVWDGDYPVQVVLKDESVEEPSYDDIANQYVSAWGGTVSVPVRQIADVEPDWHSFQIAHRNGIPYISVQSDVKEGVNTTSLTKQIVKEVEKIDFPQGISYEIGGSQESDDETMGMIMSGLVVSIIVIFFILLFHFRRINMALLILGSIALCLLGAALGMWIMGLDMSVTAVLGIVSLMGILVRNGIIMLDYADELRIKEGLSVREAALHSAKRRMRPIFLTSAAASMGVVPMILSGSALWSPMGTVVFFGTIVSMVLTVTILPVAYWLIFRRADRKTVNQ